MSASPAGTTIETGYADVGGIRTFYRRVPGDGPPAVFSHGVPTHSEDWVPFLEAMEGPALAFDLPGFGRADRPDPSDFDYSMWSQADFFGRALDVLGVGDHSLVVHDWGGLALITALARPERVRRLVAMNCLPLLPGYRWHRTARIWRTPVLGEISTRLWNRRLADFALRESRGDRSPHDPEFVDMIWDHLDRGTFDAILRLYRSGDPEELERAGRGLGGLDCPSLVVWGGRDPYISPRFGSDYAEVLGGELVEYPDAGHWLWRDQPEAIPLVVKFLAQG